MVIKPFEPKPLTAIKRATVKVRNLWISKVIVAGDRTVSGERYEFAPGVVAWVQAQDVSYLLSLVRRGEGCCTGSGKRETPYFELVEA